MSSKGFTIIELLISIFILSVAVIGIFSAFSMVAILTSDMADRLTATHLAQEGLEIIRNIRDTNWLGMDSAECQSENQTEPSPCPVSWLESIEDYCPTGCEADYTSGTAYQVFPISPWPNNGSDLLLSSDGFYNYSSGSLTKFKRKILVNRVSDALGDQGYIIKVIVEVSWDKKATILNSRDSAGNCGQNNCIKAEYALYDWYNYKYH